MTLHEFSCQQLINLYINSCTVVIARKYGSLIMCGLLMGVPTSVSWNTTGCASSTSTVSLTVHWRHICILATGSLSSAGGSTSQAFGGWMVIRQELWIPCYLMFVSMRGEYYCSLIWCWLQNQVNCDVKEWFFFPPSSFYFCGVPVHTWGMVSVLLYIHRNGLCLQRDTKR